MRAAPGAIRRNSEPVVCGNSAEADHQSTTGVFDAIAGGLSRPELAFDCDVDCDGTRFKDADSSGAMVCDGEQPIDCKSLR
jgi:hypothetical protein